MEYLKLIFDIPSSEELLSRINKAKDLCDSKGLDCVLIFSNVNLFYFTNSIQRGCFVCFKDTKPKYFVQRHFERAKAETSLDVLDVIEMKSIKKLPLLLNESSRNSIKRIGIELGDISASFYLFLLSMFDNAEFVDISLDILKIRSIKSEYELMNMKKAAEMSDKVFSKAGSFIREGMSEVELCGYIQLESRKLGNQEIIRMRGFNNELTNPHLLSGKSGAIPSAGDVPLSGYGTTSAVAQGGSFKKILKGEPIIVDYAGSHNGYVTDETRLYVIGKLPEDLRRAYWVSREIIDFIEDNVCEGKNGKDIYSSILKIVEKNNLIDHFMGYGKDRVKFVAHGIGLVINELPIIADSRDEELKENMVFSVEPKFVFPEKGAVGVEVDYIVKRDGVKRLSSFPLEIVEV